MLTGALIAGVAMLVLYFFAPEEHRFYPRCLFYSLTGVQCPGCGGLRAMHRLLHGEVAAAWHLNPIVVILFPVATAWSFLYLFKRELAERCALVIRQPAFLWSVCAAAVLFSVLRWALGQFGQ